MPPAVIALAVVPIVVHIVSATVFTILGAGETSAAFLLGAAWVIGLAVAQRIIGRQHSQRRSRTTFRVGVV